MHGQVGAALQGLGVGEEPLEPPTNAPGGSAAAEALNREGRDGWEAFGMTALRDGSMAVLLKRPIDS